MRDPSENHGNNGHIARFGRLGPDSKFGFAIATNHRACYSNVVDVQFHSRVARLRGHHRSPAIIEPVGSTNRRSGTSARINDGRVRG